jgi:hypothetical protein
MPRSFPGLQVCEEAADRIEALEADDKVFSENMIALEARIAALETALEDITIYSDDPTTTKIAREALAPEQDK